MNLGIRAILYSARKWKKTLLVFCLLLAITTLVLSGLAIAVFVWTAFLGAGDVVPFLVVCAQME